MHSIIGHVVIIISLLPNGKIRRHGSVRSLAGLGLAGLMVMLVWSVVGHGGPNMYKLVEDRRIDEFSSDGKALRAGQPRF